MDQPAPQSLAELLRTARLRLNLTQDEVGERLGIHRRTISAWETGASNRLTPDAAQRYAAVLGINLDDFNPPDYNERVIEFPTDQNIITVSTHVGIELVRRLHGQPDELRHLDRRAFEQLIAEIWDGFGYAVELTAQTRDGGKDVIAIGGLAVTEKFLIECKRPDPGTPVRVAPVRELYGVVMDDGATKGILATTTYFTTDAKLFLDRHKWQLEGQDFEGVMKWMKTYLALHDETA
jgi:transcriptional regulator with XRE-family HTH domain